MNKNTFLLEIGTEELPPGSLRTLGEALQRELLERVDALGIAHGASRWFATPRRLAVQIEGLADMQPDTFTEKLGPAVSAAFNADGTPTPAAAGFARGCGVAVNELARRSPGDKGERLAFRKTQPGKPVVELLPAAVDASLNALPIAKRMRWGAHRIEFVRPVHWVVMLFGEALIRARVLGIETDRMSRGHRVLGEASIALRDAAEYEIALRDKGHVIADYEERKSLIAAQVRNCAATASGSADLDDALLEEVCSLVEWPRALMGRFDERFLDVPAEALVSSMKKHQRYFPVLHADGSLMPCFIAIANIDSRDPAQVIAGNERVIRPRLSDAAFFTRKTRQTSLIARREALRDIVFQSELGTLWEKTERIAHLARLIGNEIGADPLLCERAGNICKSDLVSEMVLEFAELQGTMGAYYARHDGEHSAVVAAMREQYQPRQAGDALPTGKVGMALALADRLDTLVGIFCIGQAPSGSRDPFGARRAALGVLRIMVENALPLDLQPLLEQAAREYGALPRRDSVVDTVRDYVLERLRAVYGEAGIPAECFLAVHARGISHPLDFDRRVRAVALFSTLPQAPSLAHANKRVANILLKQDGASATREIDSTLLREPAEQELFAALTDAGRQVEPLLRRADYAGVLRHLADLQAPVDRFFDKVLVMSDDATLRDNRLALLQRLRAAFLQVADISALAVSG